jgi:hypothetical protein
MAVSAQDGNTVLPTERRNPSVIRRDWSAGFLEFTAEGGVGDGVILGHVEYPAKGNHLHEPTTTFSSRRRPTATPTQSSVSRRLAGAKAVQIATGDKQEMEQAYRLNCTLLQVGGRPLCSLLRLSHKYGNIDK